MNIIIATIGSHAATINDLCQRGIINPCAFTITYPDGSEITRYANSVWAATDWLKTNGIYTFGYSIRWSFNLRP